ncbi:hypothetical protein [Clostridium beijerinckii]|uniref:Uncharacterized protein n=1 Tax=Clostridium beijerinckii TaxID=1520 RepID=A0AAX0B8Y6_CLOBE|nr:hypothetical protein [Clostridium beijerinckii]NRT91416.1 hypothetical protein [Clostridium beijerinckii]NYC70942.1 hypothetical protein [Clostridium beijerinckii]
MSEQFEFNCNGHNSIYTKDYLENNYNERNFKVYFSTPDNGVNCETGLLLLIAGFDANSQSNIYKKMRQNFSDLYNLVTIQCDYFGSEFMQNNLPLNLSKDSINILNNFDLFMNDNIINFDKLKNIREQKWLRHALS